MATLLAALLFGSAAQAAVHFRAVQATGTSKPAVNGITPVPTTPPHPAELARRLASTTMYFASDNTCGYISGSLDNGFSCVNDAAQCAISTLGSIGYLGCCSTTCGSFVTTCVDYNEYYSSPSACLLDCMLDPLTLKCTNSDRPYCNSVRINGGDTLTVNAPYCASYYTATIQILQTSYSGEKYRSFSLSVMTGAAATDAQTFGGTISSDTTYDFFTSSSSSSTRTRTTTSTSSTITPITNGGGGGSSGSSSKTNVGAIAGGVVGGVAGLALIAGLIAFFLIRSRRKARQQPQMQMQQNYQNPGGYAGPGVAPGGGGGSGGAGGMAPMAYPPQPPQPQQMPQQPQMPQPYQQPQYQMPPQPQPQPLSPGAYDPSMNKEYAAAAAVPTAPANVSPPQQPASVFSQPSSNGGLPDRTGSTSPLAPEYSGRVVSNGSFSSSVSPISPQTTGGKTLSIGSESHLLGATTPSTPGIPPTIHEASSNIVGGEADNHRGRMHELA